MVTLAYIWDRFHHYRQQKTQVVQWDAEGRKIKRPADQSADGQDFIGHSSNLMACAMASPSNSVGEDTESGGGG